MGIDYWHEILRFIQQMAKAGLIASSDMQLVYVTDLVDDAIAHIRSHAIERFALLALRRVPLTGAGWENAVYRRLSSH
jgi:predicted Rossmann-fold nucleotide-binding protein